jgi:hypothetical protein
MSLARARSYLRKTRDPMANLLLVLPLVLVYGVGVVFLDPRAFNGADVITERLFLVLGREGLAVFYALVAAAFAVALTRLERGGSFDSRIYGLIVAESFVYALLLGQVTVRVLWHLGLGPSDPVFSLPLGTRVLVSIGAGVNEELVFRLLMIGALLPVMTRLFGGNKTGALVTLVLASSFLFSVAHFLGEPPSLDRFFFRFVAGILFAVIYRLRGFAVAVYTHAIYDIHVLVLA